MGEKAGHGHVPALPEFGDGAGAVGGVEVARQINANHFGSTCGNITVAGEVKVKLEGVGKHGNECGCRAEMLHIVPCYVDRLSEDICQKHLFGKTIADEGQSAGEVLPVEGAVLGVAQLWYDFTVKRNRTAHDIGEEGDKECIFRQRIRLCLAVVGIYQIGNLLKGEKADAERKQQRNCTKVGADKTVEVG